MLEPSRLAPIAHDERTADMVAFAKGHVGFLGQRDIAATGTTGQRILDMSSQFGTRRLQSGLLGAAD